MFLIYQLAPTPTVGHYYNSPYKRSPPDLFEDILRIFLLCEIYAPPSSGLQDVPQDLCLGPQSSVFKSQGSTKTTLKMTLKTQYLPPLP